MSRELEDGPLTDATIASTVGDAVYQLDSNGYFLKVNDAVVAATGYDRDELLGSHVSLLVNETDAARFEDEIKALLANGRDEVGLTELPIRTATGRTIPCEIRFSAVQSEGEFAGTVGVVRDISRRKRHDAELRAQRDELDRLRRINAVIRSIDRAVVRAETVSEVEQSVCDRLAEADTFRFALVVRFDPQFEKLIPQTWAGNYDEYVEYLRESDIDVSEGPGVKAIKTRSVQAIQDIDRDEHDWSEAALECGFESLAAVPLAHEEVVYGVLAVYSERPYAFDDAERELLAELAELVGYALFAIKTRQALVAERVVELEFRLADEDYVFTALSAREDCTVTLEDAVLHPDGSLLLYVSVFGGDPERVVEFCHRFEGVTHLRVISKREDECSLEIRYGEPMVLRTLSHRGGVIRSAVAEDGVARLQIDLPERETVREVVDTLDGIFDTVELVSRKTVERPIETRSKFRDTLDQALTDRQRTVLVAAYRGGYFDWPRESTGEELAKSLDIAAPTLHKHLRLAEGKLLAAIFDDADSG
ncbi:bacterio-opsin activator domain-containing protein [Haladaptatus caseinilyticus]|uniref:bacterio-opsin activator domain-containing protein n=1 Tax=Haladaptatus caseinilyticus TaxID=2993314 RepID=UPI00224A8508|nr:bacterio-opsin activator domain-containing protein [Haladaptatus caseinilyticus]